MPFGRAFRRRCAALIAAVLLFAQFSVAAHACMKAAGGHAEAAASMAVMHDCAGMGAESLDADEPQRCKAHCEAPGLQPLGAPALDIAGLPLVALPGWPLPAAAGLAPPRPYAVDQSPPAGAPPLYLSLLVLRN